jgi:hypothetical protein
LFDVTLNFPFAIVCPGNHGYPLRRVVGRILFKLVKEGYVHSMHFGTPCQSQTWGRLPALRTTQFVRGLPNLTGTSAELVGIGNALADFTFELCFCLYEYLCLFSVENPLLSWLWAFSKALALSALPGVIFTDFRMADHGGISAKPTAVLHKSPKLHRLAIPTQRIFVRLRHYYYLTIS